MSGLELKIQDVRNSLDTLESYLGAYKHGVTEIESDLANTKSKLKKAESKLVPILRHSKELFYNGDNIYGWVRRWPWSVSKFFVGTVLVDCGLGVVIVLKKDGKFLKPSWIVSMVHDTDV